MRRQHAVQPYPAVSAGALVHLSASQQALSATPKFASHMAVANAVFGA